MKINSLIEWVFSNEAAIRLAVVEKRAEQSAHKEKTGGSGKCFISNPTETQAIRNLSELASVAVIVDGVSKKLYNPEKWLDLISIVKLHFEGQLQIELYNMKYSKHPLKAIEIMKRLKISKPWYHILNNELLCYAQGVAVGKGLIPPNL